MKKVLFFFIFIAILIVLTKKTQSFIFNDIEKASIHILKRDTIKLKGVFLNIIRLHGRNTVAEIKVLNSNYKCYDKRNIDVNNYYGVIFNDTARLISNTVFMFEKGDTIMLNIDYWNKNSLQSLKTHRNINGKESFVNFLFEYQFSLNDYFKKKYGEDCLCD